MTGFRPQLQLRLQECTQHENGSSRVPQVQLSFKSQIEIRFLGEKKDHSELAFAIFPNAIALGFTVRFWVSRSTAISPNFGV